MRLQLHDRFLVVIVDAFPGKGNKVQVDRHRELDWKFKRELVGGAGEMVQPEIYIHASWYAEWNVHDLMVLVGLCWK